MGVCVCVGVRMCGFCNVLVCVCVGVCMGFVMCGCFGNTCTAIYRVFYCLYCVFVLFQFMYIYSYPLLM